MEIVKSAQAGTLESSDVLVSVEPNRGGGLALAVESEVAFRFGSEIRRTALTALEALGVREARVKVEDRSALDCVIRARVEAAALRAAGADSAPWEEIDTCSRA